VEVVGHQEQETNVPNPPLVSVLGGIENGGRNLGIAKLVSLSLTTANGHEKK
jgi:hypothetical protein